MNKMVTNTLKASYSNPSLHEIHRATIRSHHAKVGYDYPTIRLPFTFSGLIGRSTRIFQTVHEGALAFLVVVSSASKVGVSSPDKRENAFSSADAPRLDMAEVAGSNPAEPIRGRPLFRFCEG